MPARKPCQQESKEDTLTTVSKPADRQLALPTLSGITSKLQKIVLVEVLVFLV